ncbi:MAG: phosphoribosylglycinamide formyltransferase [Proteobacteria bacterium]|jgi:phosphoribosylglycinamide formyltransferase-1|nr:phosphoribosylglycinamide formyltransferase [Pseudomonadota bacterium]
MKKIIVLISGSGSNLQAIIDDCNAKRIDAEIACVISNNPNAFGLERAKLAGIKTIVINHKEFVSRELFDNELYILLKKHNPDLIVLAGFMRILTKKITENFYGKLINIHPSLLPKYPGLNTHEKAIKNNDKVHGVSIHYVSSELDDGPLIAQGEITTGKEDVDTLIERIHKLEHKIYPEIIKYICNGQIYLDSNKVIFEKIDLEGSYISKKYEI